MEQKKILIIDDDLQRRKSHYENALKGKYIVEYADNADLIYQTIEETWVDLYIIDLNLSSYKDPKTKDSLHVLSVLKEIGKNKPIILLSGTYKELVDSGKLEPIIQNAAEEGYNVGSFLTWEDILNASVNKSLGYKNALHSKIDLTISKDRSPYDFGIVCALEEELTPFLEYADNPKIQQHIIDGIHYRKGTISTENGHKLTFIAVCTLNMGIADSSVIATHMASKMGIKNIYMIGVCGGRESEGVNIGDVIIPEESVAYQRGKLKENGFSPDIQIAKPKHGGFYRYEGADKILSTLFERYTLKLMREKHMSLSLIRPRVRYEPMACADYVIDKEGALDEIAEKSAKRKLCAVDMESYAIYRVGEIMDVNTMVIKSVMDLSNNKSDKYKPYAAFMAANYLYKLLYQEIIKT